MCVCIPFQMSFICIVYEIQCTHAYQTFACYLLPFNIWFFFFRSKDVFVNRETGWPASTLCILNVWKKIWLKHFSKEIFIFFFLLRVSQKFAFGIKYSSQHEQKIFIYIFFYIHNIREEEWAERSECFIQRPSTSWK